MTTEKGVLCSVVILATLLVCTTEVLSQAVSSRQSGGGAIQRTHTGVAATPLLFKSSAADPLPAGSYTVGTAGYFPTLDSAFSRLSGGGILGPVTLLLTDALYVASPARGNRFTLAGPITGTGPASRITIRPSDNVAATIRGSGTATLLFQNVSYLTLDGVNLQGNTSLTVHTLYDPSQSWNDAIDLIGNCDFAVVQNLTAGTDDIGRAPTSALTLWSDSQGGPDSCLISGVAVTSGPMAIFVGGVSPSYSIRPRGNVVQGNHIGSPADSLISRGIEIEGADGTTIESNHVQNLRLNLPDNLGNHYILGISAYFCRNDIIRNNVVHNLCATVIQTYIDGILLTGSSTQRGANVWVYNNMVYDIRNRVSLDVDMNGIGAWRQDSARIDYNSVYLSPAGSKFATLGSSALGFYSTASFSTARNNILVNLRQELSSVALALWFSGNNWKLSDYNDLHVGQFDSSFVASYGGISYKSIDGLHSDGKESHSVSVMPTFMSPYLHLDSTSTANDTLAGRAIPLSGIAADFDGQLRDPSAPDIGADEIIIIPGVPHELGMPEEYALSQNYPNPFNPSTTVKFELPRTSHVSLSVYDILGREVSELVNERKEVGVYEVRFDGSNLASGVYLYRLQAGDFIQVKKLLILK